MSPKDTALANQLREFAVEASNDVNAARRIIALAIASGGVSTLTAARAAEVIEQFPDALGGFEERIAEFRADLTARVDLIRVIDKLSDLETPAQNILDLADSGQGQLEISDIDFDALHRARIRADHRADGVRRMLEQFGWDRIDPSVAPNLRLIVDELVGRADQFQAHGLFVDQQNDRGYALGIQVHPDQSGKIRPRVEIGTVMKNQAELALSKALPDGAGAEWNIEWPFDFDGASIGLGLYVGALVARHELDPDPLLAVTGEIDINEHVLPVVGIEAKLQAAARSGFLRVLVPEGNRDEATQTAAAEALHLIYVNRTGEIAAALAQIATGEDESFGDRVARCRKRIRLTEGLAIRGERELPNAYRFEVGDTDGSVFIDVFTGSRRRRPLRLSRAPTPRSRPT